MGGFPHNTPQGLVGGREAFSGIVVSGGQCRGADSAVWASQAGSGCWDDGGLPRERTGNKSRVWAGYRVLKMVKARSPVLACITRAEGNRKEGGPTGGHGVRPQLLKESRAEGQVRACQA